MKQATIFRPEMGDTIPEETQIVSKFSIFSGKFRLKSTVELKGRGIKYEMTYDESNCNNPRYFGLHVYSATQKAYEKLEKEFNIAHEVLLD